jgi:arsenate reductase-like glutaredoxin family protein
VNETVNASKQKIGAKEALKLLEGVRKLIVAKGKKTESFDLANNRPDDQTLLDHMLGPTGNLRAPTLRIGATMLIGYNEEAYQQALGTR